MAPADPFNGWERPAFCIGQLVQNGDRVGIVYGFVAWEFPMVLYAVRLQDGACETWHRGDLEPLPRPPQSHHLEVLPDGA